MLRQIGFNWYGFFYKQNDSYIREYMAYSPIYKMQRNKDKIDETKTKCSTKSHHFPTTFKEDSIAYKLKIN